MTRKQITPFRFYSKCEEFEKCFFKEIHHELNTARKGKFYAHNMYKYSHGMKWSTSLDGIENNDPNEMEIHVTETVISSDKIVDHELSELKHFKEKYISQVIKEQVTNMYQTISQAANEAGSIVTSKSGQFQPDQFIKMLEGIDLSVNIDGTVSLPEIHANPSLAKTIVEVLSNQGPEFQERVDEIIQNKEQQALERERERKAKFPYHG